MRTKEKRWIGFVIIFILLLTGICSKGMESYSSSSSLLLKSSSQSRQTFGKINTGFSYEKVCTIRMIRGGQEGAAALAGNLSRVIFRNFSFLASLEHILPNLFLYYTAVSVILCKLLDSMPVVLNYIHKQDGEK